MLGYVSAMLVTFVLYLMCPSVFYLSIWFEIVIYTVLLVIVKLYHMQIDRYKEYIYILYNKEILH